MKILRWLMVVFALSIFIGPPVLLKIPDLFEMRGDNEMTYGYLSIFWAAGSIILLFITAILYFLIALIKKRNTQSLSVPLSQKKYIWLRILLIVIIAIASWQLSGAYLVSSTSSLVVTLGASILGALIIFFAW